MDFLTVNCTNALVDKRGLESSKNCLKVFIQSLLKRKDSFSQSPYAFIQLPDDRFFYQQVKNLVDEKKKIQPAVIVVVGIGGSHLGIQAVQEALLGVFYNQVTKGPKIYYADSVDTDYINVLLELCRGQLASGSSILLIIISKSGLTTEVIANAHLFIELLSEYSTKDYTDNVVVITDSDSSLYHFAYKKGYSLLEIPAGLGGRYSVLSAVGLFPLAMLGVDIEGLLAGAQEMNTLCLQENIECNSAAMSALALFAHYGEGKNIVDMFLFSLDFEFLGKWYRQLVGESLAKEYNVKGKRVNVGLTPTVSLGTRDLHSVGQLYVAGPKDKSTIFVTVQEDLQPLVVPNIAGLSDLGPNLSGKKLSEIMRAIVQGTQKTYQNHELPFITIAFSSKSAYCVGQFLQYAMFQVVYLATLLEVNPFDQPAVQEYKKETRFLLE